MYVFRVEFQSGVFRFPSAERASFLGRAFSAGAGLLGNSVCRRRLWASGSDGTHSHYPLLSESWRTDSAVCQSVSQTGQSGYAADPAGGARHSLRCGILCIPDVQGAV